REAPLGLPAAVRDGDGVRVLEARGSGDERDGMPFEVPVNLARLLVDDVLQAVDELAEALLAVEPDAHPVELPPAEAGQVKGRLPQGLGGERAGVNRRAADFLRPLHESDLPAEVGGLGRALLPGRAGTDDDEIEALGFGHGL